MGKICIDLGNLGTLIKYYSNKSPITLDDMLMCIDILHDIEKS